MNPQLIVLLLFLCGCNAFQSKILCVDNACSAQLFTGQLISDYVDTETKLILHKSLKIDVVGKVESDPNTLLIKHQNSYFLIDHSFVEKLGDEQIPELHSVLSPVNISPPSKVRFTTASTASINKPPPSNNKSPITDTDALTPGKPTAAVHEHAQRESAPSTTDDATLSLEEQMNRITKEADEVMRREMERELKEEQARQKFIESRQSNVDENPSKVPAVANKAVTPNQEPTQEAPKTASRSSITTKNEHEIEKQKEVEPVVRQTEEPVQLGEQEKAETENGKRTNEKTTKQPEKDEQAKLEQVTRENEEKMKQMEKVKIEEVIRENDEKIRQMEKVKIDEEMRRQVEEKTKQMKVKDEQIMVVANAEKEATSEGREAQYKAESKVAQLPNEVIQQQSKETELKKTSSTDQEKNRLADSIADAKQIEKLSVPDQLANQSEEIKDEKLLSGRQERKVRNENENVSSKSLPEPHSIDQHPHKEEEVVVIAKENNNDEKLHREEQKQEEEEGNSEKLKQDKKIAVDGLHDQLEVAENAGSNSYSSETGQSLDELDIRVLEDLGSSTSSLSTNDNPHTDDDNENDDDILALPTPNSYGFLQCLIMYANVNNTPVLIGSTSSGKRSTLAYLCTIFIQQVFVLADQVTSYLPSKFVTITDSVLLYTCNIPFTYLVAWIIFLLSIFLTFLLMKLAYKIILGGSGNSVANRTLEEWLAIEENANQLADRLADQEEANARQTIWVTHLREQCTGQNNRELQELKATHDALAEHLARVKHQSSVNSSHQEEQIASLSRQLHNLLEEKRLILSQGEELRQSLVNEANEEKRALLKQSEGYAARVAEMETAVERLTESNGKLEEDLVARAREIASLRDAFIQLKIFEIALAEKKTVVEKPKGNSTTEPNDGWEVEELDLEELNPLEDAPSTSQNNDDQENIQQTLENFLDLGKLKATLTATEEQLRSEKCKREQEAQIRTQLQEELVAVKESLADLSQKLIQSNEDKEASVKKLEILSQYFTEREAVMQRDLGRKALTESESSEELNFLKQKTKALDAELQTLSNQLISVRREKVEMERLSRQRISELDKRLHDDWLAARSSENLIKELRDENASLRQKIGEGEKAFLNQLISRGMSLPIPPPPRGSLGKRSVASPELRNSSLPSGIIPPPPPPPPPPFMTPPPGMPFLTAPDGSLISPPTLPTGMPFLRPLQPSNRSSPVNPGWKMNSGNMHVTPNSSSKRS